MSINILTELCWNVPYFIILRFEKCCEWWTGHGKAHPKSTMNHRAGCCGAERITWGAQSCCYGHPDPPQVYDHATELCCNAHKVNSEFNASALVQKSST